MHIISWHSFLCVRILVIIYQFNDRTLSPMSSFQSELGVNFGTSLEAPHVINVDSQVQSSFFKICWLTLVFYLSHFMLQLWAGVIHSGPDNYPLNGSYKTSESYGFQVSFLKTNIWTEHFSLCYVMMSLFLIKDALGTSLEEIFKVVPGGCLVFFPSYKLMDKLRNRWSQTGQWSSLNAQKPVFVGEVQSYFINVSRLRHKKKHLVYCKFLFVINCG